MSTWVVLDEQRSHPNLKLQIALDILALWREVEGFVQRRADVCL